METTQRTWFGMTATDADLSNNNETLRQSSGMLLGMGILAIIAGVAALMNAFAATIVTVMVLGSFLTLGGIMYTIDAFTIRKWNMALLDVLAAILYFVAAYFTFRQPIAAAATITIVLASLFMVGGAVRFIGAVAMRPANWGWQMTHGIVTFLLGMALFMGMPLMGLTGPGILVGVDLLLSGISATALGVALRRTTHANRTISGFGTGHPATT